MTERKEEVVDPEDWIQLHADKKTAWHADKVHAKLIELRDTLFFKPSPRVFVPLCGRTLDMKWFYDQGCTVVGVDLAAQALKEFFEEHRVPYSVHAAGDDSVYCSDDGRMKLFACSLYDFPETSNEKNFDVIWDRGSLVAINKNERKQYVALMTSLVSTDFRYLLETYEYDQTKYGGTPRTFSDDELKELFGARFNLKHLSKVDFPLPQIQGASKARYSLMTPLKKA